MKSPRKTRRIRLILIGIVLLLLAVFAIIFGFKNSIEYFRSPTQIVKDGAPVTGLFRLGGLVKEGSIVISPNDQVTFIITDRNAEFEVNYTGLLPDAFGEGQGAIARGNLLDNVFIAKEIVAKHDENYMPREVVDALKEQGVFRPK